MNNLLRNDILLLFSKYEFEKASLLLKKLYKKGETDILEYLIFSLHMSGNNEEALHYIHKLKKENFSSLIIKAEALYMLGRYNDSVSTLYKAKKFATTFYRQCIVDINLGYSLLMLGNFLSSLKNFKIAYKEIKKRKLEKKLLFEIIAVLNGLGCCYAMLGKRNYSISLFKEALNYLYYGMKDQELIQKTELYFLFGETYSGLGAIFYSLDNKEGGKKCLKKAVYYFKKIKDNYCNSRFLADIYIKICNFILNPSMDKLLEIQEYSVEGDSRYKTKVYNSLIELMSISLHKKQKYFMNPFPAPVLPCLIAILQKGG